MLGFVLGKAVGRYNDGNVNSVKELCANDLADFVGILKELIHKAIANGAGTVIRLDYDSLTLYLHKTAGKQGFSTDDCYHALYQTTFKTMNDMIAFDSVVSSSNLGLESGAEANGNSHIRVTKGSMSFDSPPIDFNNVSGAVFELRFS